MKQLFSRRDVRSVYWFVGICSLLLSAWLGLRHETINNDGVCYIMSAKEYGVSGLSAAMHICGQAKWPLYSVLIHYVAKVTFLSEINAALLLNAGLTLISVLAFVAVVRELGANKRVMWLAAFVILFAHQFNSVREYIIRDHGFWAFYLVSMLCLLRFLYSRNWLQALGFGVSIGIATLFRIEGAVFLALLPLLALTCGGTWKQRAYDVLKLHSMTCIMAGLILLWMIAHPAASVERLGRVAELTHQAANALSIIVSRYQHSVTMLGKFVLPSQALRDAGTMWFVAVAVMYVINIVNNLSWAATAVVLYAWLSGVTRQFSRPAKLVLFGYLAVNIFVTALFYAEHMFLSKRYLIAMTLVLLCWVPFALEQLLSVATSVRARALGQLAMAVMVASCLGVFLGLGPNKAYIRDAGAWVAQNVPATAKFYSNDKLLAFYSQQYGNAVFSEMRINRNIQAMVQGKLQNYDYAALRSGREADDRLSVVLNEMHASVTKTFMNKRGDNVTIYKIPRRKLRS